MPAELPAYFTLLQAVAWITTRHVGVVLRASLKDWDDALNEEDSDLVDQCFPSTGGFRLISLDLWNGCRSDGDGRPTSEAACQDLLRRLRSGTIEASREADDGSYRAIDSRMWDHLTFEEPTPIKGEEAPRKLIVRTPGDSSERDGYRHIFISRDDLLRSYPPDSPISVSEDPGAPVDQSIADTQQVPDIAVSGPANNGATPDAPQAPVPTPQKTKRKSNGRDYSKADAPLVKEMQQLINVGSASSPEKAAERLIKRGIQIEGGGTNKSKVARLAKGYRAQFQVQSALKKVVSPELN
jgi:hypothetical protein